MKKFSHHIQHPMEVELVMEAKRISENFNGAPVVIILAGEEKAKVSRCMTASSLEFQSFRLQKLLGILETSKQIETLKHFCVPPFNKKVDS